MSEDKEEVRKASEVVPEVEITPRLALERLADQAAHCGCIPESHIREFWSDVVKIREALAAPEDAGAGERDTFFAGFDAATSDAGLGFYATETRERHYQAWLASQPPAATEED